MIYDHQDAILLAVNEELERLQKVAALDAQVPSKDVLVSTQNLGADVTMTVDLDSEDESEDEELEVDTDGNVIPSAVNGAKKNKKKTKAQLNRAMKQRKLEEEIARQKEQRRVENEVLLYV